MHSLVGVFLVQILAFYIVLAENYFFSFSSVQVGTVSRWQRERSGLSGGRGDETARHEKIRHFNGNTGTDSMRRHVTCSLETDLPHASKPRFIPSQGNDVLVMDLQRTEAIEWRMPD